VSKVTHLYDVFLSHTARDAGVAEVVRRALAEAGLEVFSADKLESGDGVADTVREALAESRVFVAVLTRAALSSPWITTLLGAAWGWKKAVYLLLEGVSLEEVPSFLKRFKIQPMARLPEVIKEVARSAAPLPEPLRERLARLYGARGIPSEQLATEPALLDALTREFNEATDSALAPEQVLQELIRLRKQGKLPRLQRR
jgi:hypothetical protein